MKDCKYECNDSGKVFKPGKGWVDCPIHGKLNNTALLLRNDNDSNVFNMLAIPEQYRNISYCSDGNQFMSKYDHRDDLDAQAKLNFAKSLSLLASGVSSKNLLACSIMFCVDEGIDLNTFIYPLLVEGYMRGLSAVPYISLKELQYKMSTEQFNPYNVGDDIKLRDYLRSLNMSYQNNNPYSYASYISADLLILRLPYSLNKSLGNVLGDILEERAGRGKSTYVIGSLQHYYGVVQDKSTADGTYIKNFTIGIGSNAVHAETRLSRLKLVACTLKKKHVPESSPTNKTTLEELYKK